MSFTRNGAISADNNYNLITKLARGEWGFKGDVGTDAGGGASGDACTLAGNDAPLMSYGTATSGVTTQYESEAVYSNMLKEVEDKGVVFLDTDTGLKLYPEIFKKYFGKLVPPTDNKYAALNSAVWSGGSFIYVPKGVKLEKPLQSYFRKVFMPLLLKSLSAREPRCVIPLFKTGLTPFSTLSLKEPPLMKMA